MYVHDGLPAGRSGRPGQRSDASTACGMRSRASRWFAPAPSSAGAASGVTGAGSTLSTAPSTLFGLNVARPFSPDRHAWRYRSWKSAYG